MYMYVFICLEKEVRYLKEMPLKNLAWTGSYHVYIYFHQKEDFQHICIS